MLEPAMRGSRFRRVIVNRPNLRIPFPKKFADRLRGKAVDAVDRRGAQYVHAQIGRIVQLFGAADIAGVRAVIDSLLIAGGLQTLVCLPLLDGATVFGAVYADRRGTLDGRPGEPITDFDLELLTAFAERAGDYWPKGATGSPVRALVGYVLSKADGARTS